MCKGHNLPITGKCYCHLHLCCESNNNVNTASACYARPVRKRGKDLQKEKEAERHNREYKASRGGRCTCSAVWVCVVFNREVGGEEKEEDGVLPLQSGLSCWCIPAAPVHSNRKPWYKKLRRRGNPPKCLSAAAWPGPRAWECGLNNTMPSLIDEPQHFIMDQDDRKTNKNMWVKVLPVVSNKYADLGLDEKQWICF